MIAHGCLHLLEREHWQRLLRQMKDHTVRGGYHVVAVFTNALEPPEDLRQWTLGLFNEGELFSRYGDWRIIEKKRAMFWKINIQVECRIAIQLTRSWLNVRKTISGVLYLTFLTRLPFFH